VLVRLTLLLTLLLAGTAAAQTPPPLDVPAIGGFHSVLAQGEGQTVLAADLAANQLNGTVPARFTDQQPLYVGVTKAASSLTEADIPTYYKDAKFGSMPGGVESVSTPRDGIQIFRDQRYGMAHVYGATRSDVMYGAGYATAEERLFLMDALRRTAEGRLAGLTGPGAASDDAQQLTDQDFSPEELTAQVDALPQRFGAEGEQARKDMLDYVAGINQRIDEVNADPLLMPAEYAALGTTPEPWTIADSAALATLLVTQFTVSNGSEEVNAQLRQAFQKRFGKRWRGPFKDLREAEDPEALVVAKRRFNSDRTGKRRPGLNAIPDAGSIKPRNPQVEGPGAAQQAAARAAMPAWVQRLMDLKSQIPHHASNAVMVAGSLSKDGKPLAAMGPQVSYYSPQIFSEYELHGGGIDSWGVTFPGSNPFPLIGHGIDFSWSGTSANGDNQDTFVEKLCEPDGSTPSRSSMHYVYKGECRAFVTRDQSLTTPFSPVAMEPPTKITYRTLRSVHGPVFATATVKGVPVALTKAKGVDFHEIDAILPFKQLAENAVHNAKEFRQAFSIFPGTENWFYVDDRSVTFQQSGNYPRHARGTDVDLPYWGTGKADWQNFDPEAYTFRKLPNRQRPTATNPRDGFIISWNNKEARGWRKGPREWDNGPVHRALILKHWLLREKRRGGGKVDFAGLTRAVNRAATTDLIADAMLPWLLRVVRTAPAKDRPYLTLLRQWRASGGQRLDADGNNVYDHSAAIALMDAWWPRLVRGIFEPTLGQDLFDEVESRVLGLGDFGWSWASHVQKDLRAVLGKRVRGHYSRQYCGATRRACRKVLLEALHAAIAEEISARGEHTSDWKVPATCEQTDPASCDQIVPTTAGAIDTPPFPWQNRGTYHQVVKVRDHRGAATASVAAAGPQRKLDGARGRWSDLGARDYRFKLTVQRFRSDQTYKLKVRNGKPVRPPDDAKGVASVARLFRTIQRALDGDYADVDVTYGKRGLPRQIFLNASDEIADEEVTYFARGLQVDHP
jgi:acyl-homoserine lactone acylase PvdQ